MAADKIAEAHSMRDGLDAIAKANGMSRSKATKTVSNKFQARQLMDNLFKQYGSK